MLPESIENKNKGRLKIFRRPTNHTGNRERNRSDSTKTPDR